MADAGSDSDAAGREDAVSDRERPDGEPEAGESAEALRRQVEERYDFEEFGPREMAEMSREEWEAAFDPDSWLTGPELLDRVEADLRGRVESHDVFAVVEREPAPAGAPGDERLVAYSDEGFAVVYGDGTVEGRGTVLRDVEPTVALCSMEDYEPSPPTGSGGLPDPEDVDADGSELGNLVMQAVGLVQLLAAAVLVGAWIAFGLSVVVPIVAFGFLVFGAFVLVLVANARLSDRFRAEEYRERLRAAGVAVEERPEFVPGRGEPVGELADPARDEADGSAGGAGSEPGG